jgi:hypothetical protein
MTDPEVIYAKLAARHKAKFWRRGCKAMPIFNFEVQIIGNSDVERGAKFNLDREKEEHSLLFLLDLIV